MYEKSNKNGTNPFIELVRSIFTKFLQSPDVYPIRYYKKGERFRRY
ncbi:MAG: hypothetical protein ABIQ31_11310 [Ferruginibacter sp.]